MRIGLRSPASLATVVIATAVTVAALAPSADGRAAGRAAPKHPTQVAKLTAAQVQALSADATKHSIVIFKNQYANLPDAGRTQPSRVKAINSNQKPVVSELSQLHARGVKRFHIVNAVAATISAAEAARLAKNPAVQAVVPDRLHALPDETSAAAVSSASGPAPSTGSGQLCPTDPKKPLLEPEALNVMHVEYADKSKPAAHDYVDGTGIKVGLIADGLDPNNPDLQRNGKSIVFDYRDFSGFGTDSPTDGREAFLDAGSIAAQGTQTYDLSGFVNPAHPLPKGCTIRIKGVAPGATHRRAEPGRAECRLLQLDHRAGHRLGREPRPRRRAQRVDRRRPGARTRSTMRWPSPTRPPSRPGSPWLPAPATKGRTTRSGLRPARRASSTPAGRRRTRCTGRPRATTPSSCPGAG